MKKPNGKLLAEFGKLGADPMYRLVQEETQAPPHYNELAIYGDFSHEEKGRSVRYLHVAESIVNQMRIWIQQLQAMDTSMITKNRYQEIEDLVYQITKGQRCLEILRKYGVRGLENNDVEKYIALEKSIWAEQEAK